MQPCKARLTPTDWRRLILRSPFVSSILSFPPRVTIVSLDFSSNQFRSFACFCWPQFPRGSRLVERFRFKQRDLPRSWDRWQPTQRPHPHQFSLFRSCRCRLSFCPHSAPTPSNILLLDSLFIGRMAPSASQRCGGANGKQPILIQRRRDNYARMYRISLYWFIMSQNALEIRVLNAQLTVRINMYVHD